MLEEKSPQLTPISAYGEFGLIKHLTENFSFENPSTEISIGDDAAVINPENRKVVVTTDILAEGVHFNLGYVPLKHLGYKAVVVNLSDIAAMNAVPTQILVSLAVSNRFPVEALEEIYAGISLACKHYKVDLVGGDTTSSNSGLVMSITAIGLEDSQNLVGRNGAKPNDLLVVTGDLGGAYLGLQILEREHAVFLANPDMQPEMEGYDYILEKQLKPEARTDIKNILKELHIKPTSMIDVSDGLSSETLHLSDQSKVGFRIYEEKIPLDSLTIATAEELNLNPVMCALNGGEDYELLFTISPNDFEKIKNHPDFTVIGHAVEMEQGNFLVARGSNELIALNAQGWDAFLRSKKS
ncbi:thiamine-phosphate kinase [Chryseobacterium koreense]|uniref:Thiamine-monophosphate kinase n=1 Tax=Chryseobacterium koreense CCUG 49689 TaxID=1304281 RepID=A0A0J7J2P7_9FLAO|nr:thiamine-phosphate kinase [Chryseobacterium koreense]KMQ72311.1 thiamine-monophosphate kinase [Chryseobacterium koreense CCUG 49689]MBB5333997.1 thiamine-monophosphate kinase [Chryseobacterium koreense]